MIGNFSIVFFFIGGFFLMGAMGFILGLRLRGIFCGGGCYGGLFWDYGG